MRGRKLYSLENVPLDAHLDVGLCSCGHWLSKPDALFSVWKWKGILPAGLQSLFSGLLNSAGQI